MICKQCGMEYDKLQSHLLTGHPEIKALYEELILRFKEDEDELLRARLKIGGIVM